MQIFRNAIRDVVSDYHPKVLSPTPTERHHGRTVLIILLIQATKHSFGAEQYWEWARIFSRLAHTDVDNGLSDLIVPFLDIGKEGELQGQIKSVVRDLEIMLRITTEQMDVIEKFEKTMGQLGQGTGNKTAPDVEPLHDEIQSSIEDLEDMRRSTNDISASVSTQRKLIIFLSSMSYTMDRLD